MGDPVLHGFAVAEEGMIKLALHMLNLAGYDILLFHELIRADMPKGYRAMSLEQGAVLGAEAFASQEWLVHVLEEELLHLVQKSQGWAREFTRGTALELELDINDLRKFPLPNC